MFPKIDRIDESAYVSDNALYNVPPAAASVLVSVLTSCYLKGLVKVYVGRFDPEHYRGLGVQPMTLGRYLLLGGDTDTPVEIHMVYRHPKDGNTDYLVSSFIWEFEGGDTDSDLIRGSNNLISTLEDADPVHWWLQHSEAVADAFRAAVAREVRRST